MNNHERQETDLPEVQWRNGARIRPRLLSCIDFCQQLARGETEEIVLDPGGRRHRFRTGYPSEPFVVRNAVSLSFMPIQNLLRNE